MLKIINKHRRIDFTGRWPLQIGISKIGRVQTFICKKIA
ncbi:hypothetical protein DYY67_1437 [Candidatus Nitrosotalea sp. TS]|nr:hypothetical protein [Candidatus Nitrosotalea sp. TS]